MRAPIHRADRDALAGRDGPTALPFELGQHEDRAQVGVHLVERRLQLRQLTANFEESHRIAAG